MIYEYILLGIAFFLMVGLILFALSLINAIIRGVPQVGTYGSAKKILEEQMPAFLTPGKRLLDLGSGTGKMSRYFTKNCGQRVDGYEVDPSNWILANVFTLFSGIKGIKYYRKNFWKLTESDLAEYDYVYVYLFPELMRKVYERLVPKMKPGTVLIVNSFIIRDREPDRVFYSEAGKPFVYIYKI